MKIQFRYRSMVLAALAISLLAIAGFPQTAWAGNANANNARAEQAAERREAARGQDKKTSDSTAQPAANNENNSAGPTTHGSENGPGGQTCNGDPDNADGAGGVYENTCDDYPDPNHQGSDNGAGDGKATGKPCEGCVGNADDKNPAGQAGGGPGDHNNGYECDQRGRSEKEGNNGIGFGNPAHTSCDPQDEECVPANDANQCKPCPGGKDYEADGTCVPKCPDGKPMPASGNAADCNPKCPDGSTMPANGKCEKCPDGQTMGSNGKCECPSGQNMGSDGTCSKPCVAGTDAVCSQVTPTCVESATVRCGGVAPAVLGETLGRLDVLGVSVEAPAGVGAAAVAPAALARTGGFQLTALVQAGLVLAIVGLGLTVMGRRRLKMVDISRRIAGE